METESITHEYESGDSFIISIPTSVETVHSVSCRVTLPILQYKNSILYHVGFLLIKSISLFVGLGNRGHAMCRVTGEYALMQQEMNDILSDKETQEKNSKKKNNNSKKKKNITTSDSTYKTSTTCETHFNMYPFVLPTQDGYHKTLLVEFEKLESLVVDMEMVYRRDTNILITRENFKPTLTITIIWSHKQ
jgi:hypothetical protein